jgi:DNA-binding MarR family transcriptional regulator
MCYTQFLHADGTMTTAGVGRARSRADAESSAAALAELVVRTSWRLRRGAAKELAPLGVTFGQARVMRVLAGASSPMRMADLAAQLEIVPRSVTTMIDGLEAAGLVARDADPHDRRCMLVTPTSGGRAVLERMDLARRATADELFAPLSSQERAELAQLLSTLHATDEAEGH